MTYEWLWTKQVLMAAAVFQDLLHLYHLYVMLLGIWAHHLVYFHKSLDLCNGPDQTTQ